MYVGVGLVGDSPKDATGEAYIWRWEVEVAYEGIGLVGDPPKDATGEVYIWSRRRPQPTKFTFFLAILAKRSLCASDLHWYGNQHRLQPTKFTIILACVGLAFVREPT